MRDRARRLRVGRRRAHPARPARTGVPSLLPATVLILFAAVALVASVLSLLRPPAPPSPAAPALRNGQWAAALEARHLRDLPGRQLAVDSWAVLRLVALGEGSPGVVVGRDGWLFSREELEIHPDSAALLEQRATRVAATARRLRRRGAELVVALVPAKARLYADRMGRVRYPPTARARYVRFLTRLAAAGVAAPDLAAALVAARPTGGDSGRGELFLRADTHWTPRGAALAAAAVAEVARPLMTAAGVPRTAFRTDITGTTAHRGDLLRFLPLGRWEEALGFGPEAVAVARTTALDDQSGGLFGTPAIAVTLIGTSYSADPRWNFAGALQHALEADVLAVANRGAGPFVPMEEYLAGGTIDEFPPRLVIWEIPERYLSRHAQ